MVKTISNDYYIILSQYNQIKQNLDVISCISYLCIIASLLLQTLSYQTMMHLQNLEFITTRRLDCIILQSTGKFTLAHVRCLSSKNYLQSSNSLLSA
jgi:hypothetical protein